MGRRTITALRIGAVAVLLLVVASWAALASRSTRPPARTVYRCLFGMDPPSRDVRIELFPSDPHLQSRQWTGYAIVKGSASQRSALRTDLGLDSAAARRDGLLFGVAAFAVPPPARVTFWPTDLQQSVDVRRVHLPIGEVDAVVRGPSVYLVFHGALRARLASPGFACVRRGDSIGWSPLG